MSASENKILNDAASLQQEVQSSLAPSKNSLHTVGYFAAQPEQQEQSAAVSGDQTLTPPSMRKK